MPEPTQEQIKEFWEWCGYEGKLESIQPVEGQKEGKLVYVSPPIDLNNLFKYAVPFLVEQFNKSFEIQILPPIYMDTSAEFYLVTLTRQKKQIGEAKNKDPALALFWALWQVKEARR